MAPVFLFLRGSTSEMKIAMLLWRRGYAKDLEEMRKGFRARWSFVLPEVH